MNYTVVILVHDILMRGDCFLPPVPVARLKLRKYDMGVGFEQNGWLVFRNFALAGNPHRCLDKLPPKGVSGQHSYYLFDTPEQAAAYIAERTPRLRRPPQSAPILSAEA